MPAGPGRNAGTPTCDALIPLLCPPDPEDPPGPDKTKKPPGGDGNNND